SPSIHPPSSFPHPLSPSPSLSLSLSLSFSLPRFLSYKHACAPCALCHNIIIILSLFLSLSLCLSLSLSRAPRGGSWECGEQRSPKVPPGGPTVTCGGVTSDFAEKKTQEGPNLSLLLVPLGLF